MWNNNYLDFRSQLLFGQFSPFDAQGFGNPLESAQAFNGLFGQDSFGTGDGAMPAAQMLPYLMSMLMQQQLMMMYLAEMITMGMGRQNGGGSRAHGQVPSGGWQNQRRLSPGTWGNPSGPSGHDHDHHDVGPSNVPPPAGGPASASEISRIPNYHQLAPSLQRAAVDAVRMGLTVTSTTGGRHTATSNHYRHNHSDGMGHAIDVAGSPQAMAAFYRRYAGSNPRELYYDPIGGIKRGQQIGPIGGHSDHVHLALS